RGLRALAPGGRQDGGRGLGGDGRGRGGRGGHEGLPSVTGRRAKKPAATKNTNATGKRISWLPRRQARPAASAHQPAPRRQGRRRARNRAITDSSRTATRVTPNQAARVSASRRASSTGTPASAPTSAGITTCSNVTSSMRFMASTKPPIVTKDTAIPIPSSHCSAVRRTRGGGAVESRRAGRRGSAMVVIAPPHVEVEVGAGGRLHGRPVGPAHPHPAELAVRDEAELDPGAGPLLDAGGHLGGGGAGRGGEGDRHVVQAEVAQRRLRQAEDVTGRGMHVRGGEVGQVQGAQVGC